MPAAMPRTSRPQVLLLSGEPLGREMLGSAIRTYELGRALAPHADVVLASPDAGREAADLDLPVVSFHRADPRPLHPHLQRADAVVCQPPWPHVAAALRRSGARLIFDLYDPEPFEALEFLADRPAPLRRLVSALTWDRISSALRSGQHLMCASEKQRDLWLGSLMAAGLLDAATYDRDPTLRSLIDVVPFGVPDAPPASGGRGPRDALEGVGADDSVVLWNGGIWNWLDAPTAIRAAGLLSERRPDLRLVFMGAATQGPARRATAEAQAVAAQLGLLDRIVFFHDQWVPYAERAGWLAQADCAVSTHVDHLETRFAFRTRLLDCFWSGLPVVCTQGDDLSARVEADDLGATVPEQDPEALAGALERVLDRGREAYAPALAAAREEYAWSRVVAPLVGWVTDPEPPVRKPADAPSERVGRRLRDAGFRTAFGSASALGLRRWPTL
jgi:glycosyltransferase involved in cell wall biosynthesis